MVKNKTQQVKACGICSLDHASDTCPQLQEETYEEAKAMGFQGQNQNFSRRNDPYSNIYNPGYKDHPNFRWRPQNPNPNPPFQQQNHPSTSGKNVKCYVTYAAICVRRSIKYIGTMTKKRVICCGSKKTAAYNVTFTPSYTVS